MADGELLHVDPLLIDVVGEVTNGVFVWDGAGVVNELLTDLSFDPANKDGLPATPSLRTLGSGAQQAARGSLVSYLAAAESYTAAKTFNGAMRLGAQLIVGMATLVSGSADVVLLDTTGGSFTVSLPAAPTAGDVFAFADYAQKWGVNPPTLDPNGKNLNGSTATVKLQTAVIIVYDGTSWFSIGRSRGSGDNVWPCNPNLIRSSDAGQKMNAALTPTFYPIMTPEQVIYALQQLTLRLTTVEAAALGGLAVYSIVYTADRTFTATRVAYLSAGLDLSTGAGNIKRGDVNGAPIGLDFIRNRYVVGCMLSSITTVKVVGQLNTQGRQGAFRWSDTGANTPTSGVRTSVTDWPTSFTQAQVSAFTGAATDMIAYAELGTPDGKLFM